MIRRYTTLNWVNLYGIFNVIYYVANQDNCILLQTSKTTTPHVTKDRNHQTCSLTVTIISCSQTSTQSNSKCVDVSYPRLHYIYNFEIISYEKSLFDNDGEILARMHIKITIIINIKVVIVYLCNIVIYCVVNESRKLKTL